MKTIQTTIAILALTIFAMSCSKDNVNYNAKKDSTHLLIKSTSSDGLINNYEYDFKNRSINYKLNGNAVNLPRDHDFSYNTDGTLDEIIDNADGSVITKYFYDASKKLIKRTYKNLYVDTYTYDNNKIYEQNVNTSSGNTYKRIYTIDTNGNISEIKYFDQITADNPNGVQSGTVVYTYDDKKSAGSSLPAAYNFPRNNKNNQLTEKYNSFPMEILIYEYNINDFPTKRTQGNEVTTYQYK